ncbi:MAG: hypothetical protein ACYCTF_10970 [Acidiferrobacter sp.]
MSRIKAASLHLAITVIALGAVFAVVRTFWYPHPLLTADGGWQAFALLAGASLVLGPLLTLVVFRSGKKNLRMDLALVAFAQIVAFGFCTHLLYVRRIQMVVYSQGAFHALDQAHIALIGPKGRALLRRLPDRPAYVYVQLPHSKKAMLGVEIRTLQGEPPIFLRGWRYRPYTASERKKMLTQGYPLVAIARKNPIAARLLARFRADHPRQTKSVFVPLRGTYSSVMLAFNPRDGRLAGMLPFNPGIGGPHS